MRKKIKILSLTLTLCFAFSLNGCLISYFYKSALPIEILSVRTFDGQTGEELIGENNQFVWRYAMDEEEKQTAMLSLANNVESMNSAAPLFLYYVIDVKPGDLINVEFEICVGKSAGLSALHLSNGRYGYDNETFATKDVTDNGKGNFTVKYTCTVQDGLYYLTAHSWENKKGQINKIPSRGGEVYNCGVFFNVNGILQEKGYLD